MAFGFILYQTGTGEFKYYYVSSNNMLFDHAITITTMEDLDNFMKKVINLDLATNYYLKKPSSSWVLAGLTNVQICIYRSPPHKYIRTFRQIPHTRFRQNPPKSAKFRQNPPKSAIFCILFSSLVPLDFCQRESDSSLIPIN